MLKIGWFSTGRGPGSRGLLEFVQGHIQDGKLDARIQYVFSNRQPGEAEGSDEFFGLVRRCGIPLVTLSSAEFRRTGGRPWAELRQDFDRRVIGLIEPYQVDVCVLAGYMLILGGEMCQRYPFLNLHPALPDGPVGTWQEVIWELIETRASQTGAMIHLATEQVDRGPVLSYCTVRLQGGPFDALWEEAGAADLSEARKEQGEEFPLFREIRAAGYATEPYLILETLRAVADGLLPPASADWTEREPRCLDDAIDAAMEKDGLTRAR